MNWQGKEYAGLVLAIALVGCKVGPDYKPPATTMPATWAEPTVGGPTTQPVSITRWWEVFKDPVLDRLIEQAVQSNNDLRIAAARVREARALRRITVSDLLPTVNGSAAYRRSRQSQATGLGNIELPAGAGDSGGIDPESDLWQAGFDATWELDIFGGTRRRVEAATADVQAAQANLYDVLVSLLAEVAANYVELRGLQQEILINQANVQAQQQTVELTRARFQAGLTGELDVVRARAQVGLTASQSPLFEAQAQRVIHRLSVLTGRQLESLIAELSQPAPIPAVPPTVAVGLPADLLRRRADIRQAERQLAAATARIGAATADLYPSFALNGTFGFQSNKFADLANWDSRAWSIGPGISLPIFDRGRIRANIQVQDARQEQALAVYENTILLALEEVENALVSYAKDQRRRDLLADTVQSNRRAVELANELYTKGLVDFLTVLEAERTLYAAEEQLSLSERAVSRDLVALYKALGGGWEIMLEPAQPQATPPQDGQPAAQ